MLVILEDFLGGSIMGTLNSTNARLGIGHCGARYTTQAMLAFLADQATASDAVFMEVSKETVDELKVLEVQTKCKDKLEMITRPDLGRIFDEEQKDLLRKNCKKSVQMQIYFGDGLSSPSIAANIPLLFPELKHNLEEKGYSVGTPFFVRYCRVNTAREIGPLLDAEVVCVLIGERPGMTTGESMSAYIAYCPNPDMSESEYTVISNISRVGLKPIDAVKEIEEKMIQVLVDKKSGKCISENCL